MAATGVRADRWAVVLLVSLTVMAACAPTAGSPASEPTGPSAAVSAGASRSPDQSLPASVLPSASPTRAPTEMPLASAPPVAAGRWRTIDIAAEGSVADVLATPEGGFLAAGAMGWNGAVWASDDGRTWRSVEGVPPVGDNEARGLGGLVVVPGGGYLAIGGQGGRYSEPYLSIVWASDDGRSWRQAAMMQGFVLDVAAAQSRFVAVGANAGLDNLNGARAWSSIDGGAWTEAPPVPGPGGSAMTSLTRFGGRWTAVGATRDVATGDIGGLAWSSSDGATWDLQSAGTSLSAVGLSEVVVDGEEMLATGSYTFATPSWGTVSRPAIMRSADGTEWTVDFERDCCGYFRSLVNRPGGPLAMYYWYDPQARVNDVVLVRSTGAGSWETIGRPQLDDAITLERLVVVGDAVWGLGRRALANNESAPVILLPPYPL
jgi:hypothetical protein